MTRARIGKAIGARSARKLIREVGGAPERAVIEEYERIVGPLGNDEIVLLTDGRLLHISYGSANLFPSTSEFRQLRARVEARSQRPREHPLGTRFPEGTGFIDAVPSLVEELPHKLRIAAGALDGSVDSLERLDRAAQRMGGSECLDDPPFSRRWWPTSAR